MTIAKRIALSLTLLLALGIAACGGGTTSSTGPELGTPDSSGMVDPGATDMSGASPTGY